MTPEKINKKVSYENIEEEENLEPSKNKEPFFAPDKKNFNSKPKLSEKIPNKEGNKNIPVQKKDILKKEKDFPQQNKDNVLHPNKKIHYRFVGKESFIELLKKVMPKEFYPTKRLKTIFEIIFLAIIVLGIFRFPISNLLAGIEIATIEIGFPLFNFLVFDLINPETFPLRIWALVVDIILFLIIAYVIDITINFFQDRAKPLSKEERGKRPKVLKINEKKTLSDKITKKIFKG